jgi:streptogramin lyase
MDRECIRTNGRRPYALAVSAVLIPLALSRVVSAALPPFTQGEFLVLDSNASAGSGQLFQVNPVNGAATPIGNGFGSEPWNMVLQSPTSLLAVDATGSNVYRLDFSTGNWGQVLTTPYQLKYPCGGMVADTDHSVMVASGPGVVFRVDTNTGQQTPFANYGGLGAFSPWGMCRLPDGSLVTTDQGNGKVVRIYPDGTSALVSSGGLLHSTVGIVALPDGTVAVGNVGDVVGQGDIIRINLQDGSQSYLTPPNSFKAVNGMSLASDGNILVADSQTGVAGKVFEVRPSDGKITLFSQSPLFANPSFAMEVQLPEPGPIGTVAIVMGLASLRRSRRIPSGSNVQQV